MGFSGAHLLVLAIPVVVLIGVVIGAYFLIKKAVAAGVREAHRKTASPQQRESQD